MSALSSLADLAARQAARLAERAGARGGTAGARAADNVIDAEVISVDGVAVAAKKGLGGRLLDTAKSHPYLTAGGVGVAGLYGYGKLTGDDSAGPGELAKGALEGKGDTTSPLSPSTDATGAGGPLGATGDIIQVDPDVLEQLIAALAHQADELRDTLAEVPDAFAQLRDAMARDSLGTATRSGGPSPILADIDTAVVETEAAFTAVVQGLITQTAGDAARVREILTTHLDQEAANAAAIDSIDTDL